MNKTPENTLLLPAARRHPADAQALRPPRDALGADACAVARAEGDRRHEGLSQTELAEYLDMEPIPVGRVIDRLEKTGFVERRADPADRRRWRLYLTPKAHAVVDEMEVIAGGLRDDALRGIDARRSRHAAARARRRSRKTWPRSMRGRTKKGASHDGQASASAGRRDAKPAPKRKWTRTLMWIGGPAHRARDRGLAVHHVGSLRVDRQRLRAGRSRHDRAAGLRVASSKSTCARTSPCTRATCCSASIAEPLADRRGAHAGAGRIGARACSTRRAAAIARRRPTCARRRPISSTRNSSSSACRNCAAAASSRSRRSMTRRTISPPRAPSRIRTTPR